MMRVGIIALAALACLGCGDDAASDAGTADGGRDGGTPAESGVDAGPSTPLELEVGDGTHTLRLRTDPLRLTLERADGSVVVASAEHALALGAAPGGDERYHSPLEAAPRQVTWTDADHGVAATSATEGVVGDGDGRRVAIELTSPSPGVFRVHARGAERTDDVALARLRLAADDGAVHGLGERFGRPDARGTIVPMQLALGGTTSGTNEHHVPVPFLVSTHAWGLFVRSREAGAFDVGATDPTQVWATFEGDALDAWLFVADTPAEVIAAYTRQTGLPRLPPRWAFAPMHWRNEWPDGATLREEMARIRTEGVPCTSLWIDNPWQTSYNDHVFDEARFPEPATMLADMRDAGYVPLVWSTPYLDHVADGDAPTNRAEELYLEARDRGLLVKVGDAPFVGPSSPGAAGAMMDFTNAEAVEFWRDVIDPVVELGVRAFKLDFAEDVLVEALGVRLGLRFSDGTTEREGHSLYPQLYHAPYRAALDELGGDDGGFLLVRASSWGGQTVADVIWPGDLDNDLREGLGGEVGGLPAAIVALQSLSASGFPAFGSDTGGFRGGMPEREALLRWAEHTAFTPILQLGGAGEHHSPWLYDAEAGAIYRTLARAHMDLVPYLRGLAVRASETGAPPVLSPALAYPEDRDGWADPYAYLLGEDLFVAPVVAPGATTRDLHLPPGTWIHWFTGESFDGARDVTVDAPLGAPPVFVRRGAILPLSPPDLDTLVEVDPPLVGPSARPFLRAWILPEGERSVTTEEGVTVAVTPDPGGLTVGVTPGEISDLRARIELAHAAPDLTGVAEVRLDGSPVTPSGAEAVRAGCDGVCWAREGDVLWLSVRRDASTTVELR